MKKVLLSLGLLAGVAGAAQAQASFGVKAGGSFTNFTGGGASSDLKYQFGFVGGLFGNFAFNDVFSVQPEVLYSMKGPRAEDSGTVGHYRFNYIDVPVLAHINADGLFFEVGPQIGFLTSAKLNVSASSGSGTSLDFDLKDAFNTIDFGYVAGLGYQMPNGPGIGLRYNGGFTDIVKDNKNSSNAIRNSAFQLYLSYQFGSK